MVNGKDGNAPVGVKLGFMTCIWYFLVPHAYSRESWIFFLDSPIGSTGSHLFLSCMLPVLKLGFVRPMSRSDCSNLPPAFLFPATTHQLHYLTFCLTSVFPKEIATSLLKLKSSPVIRTRNNPWERPPRSVVEAGLEAIVRYYEALERSGARESWKIKVVLVGAVCAGKSSVVASLVAREPRLVPLAQRTRGVDVHVEQPFMPGGAKVELVFWDFAGHDDYHSTHSLFLSGGGLFLLVVDLALFADDHSSRSNAIHIWLDTLLCRTPGAVVQIIATHADKLGESQDMETVVNDLRRTVAAHLEAKLAEYEVVRKMGMAVGDAPILRVIYKIHAVSCATGDHWPELGMAIAELTALGTTDDLGPPSTTSPQSSEPRKEKLFPSMGQTVPTIWARAEAVMDALRRGIEPGAFAQLPSRPLTVDREPRQYLDGEEAERIWRDVVERSNFLGEVGDGGATAVLKVCMFFMPVFARGFFRILNPCSRRSTLYVHSEEYSFFYEV